MNIFSEKVTLIITEDSQVGQGDQTITRNESEFVNEVNMSEIQIWTSKRNSLISEENNEYVQLLGEALSEMVELEEDDEFRIDQPVYAAACHIAGQLMSTPYPAPRIFNHGPKSVVFNWSAETNNLYFTISSNTFSALVSSPERITFRKDYTFDQLPNPSLFLPFIEPNPDQQAIVWSQAVSEPAEAF